MSWKLTKKLKETHLSPLGNPFSRSSSTSTVVPESDTSSTTKLDSSDHNSTPVAQQQQQQQQQPIDTQPASHPANDHNGILASEAFSSPPPAPIRPGVLVVTLHEGKGFDLSKEQKKSMAQTQGQPGGDFNMPSSMRPNSSSHNSGSVARSFTNFTRPHTMAGVSSEFNINSMPTIHGRYSTKHLPYAMVEFDKQQIFVNAVSGTPENPLWASDNIAYKFDVARATELNISLYIRNPVAPANSGRHYDFFLGSCKLNPRFEESKEYVENSNASKKEKERAAVAHAAHERTMGQSGTEWIQVRDGSDKGMMRIGVDFVENKQRSLKIDDFELLKVVGRGSFGKVMQVKKKDTNRIYALKAIRKAHIINRSEVSHTLAERSVLAQINNPFIVPLKFSFQSPDKLYLVLAFVNGGELFHHLQNQRKFDVNRARFYTAELLCALECLHGFNVIYRDLKPENILLDYSGHIALCDFGLCKLDMKDQDTTNTFCGTPEYLAPELLHGSGYTKTVDWWTLGVLLYEMLTGLPPYYDENTNEMYRKILTEPLHFDPEHEVPDVAKDLLTQLLDRRPDKRLGVNGAAEIKAHAFFDRIDWRKLLQRRYEPVFKPNVADQLDTANFDKEFTSEAPTDSYVDGPMLSQTMQQQFAGWSYNRPVAGLGDAGGSVKDPSFGSVAR